MISAGKRYFATKLPVMHHLFYTYVLRATILPVILHQIYSLPGNFYAIILSDGGKAIRDRRGLKCD